MSSLIDFYFKKETLETILKVIEKKGEKGFAMTISVKDETNAYGQNVTGYASQTKEQREAKTPHFYTGNGKVVWTDGKITKAVKPEPTELPTAAQKNFDDELPVTDLPF